MSKSGTREFKLKIFYPSSSPKFSDRYYEAALCADEVVTNDSESFLFYIQDELVAAYPKRYTMIANIKPFIANPQIDTNAKEEG